MTAKNLREYKRKRNFRRTPEPAPQLAKKKGWDYCIQKHAASHLHYDFRLELDGVLKSWAVPKGPSLDPAVKRLAMHVEDHPVDYGDFEGIIPEGEYGGGTVMLWDRGDWEPVGDPRDGYRRGRLKFKLKGEKLQGGWNLVKSFRNTNGKGNEWFLFKENDEHAKPGNGDIVQDQPLSVKSGRDMDQVAKDQDKVWQSGRSSKWVGERKPTRRPKAPTKMVQVPKDLPGAKRAALPRRIEVKLAALVKEAPAGDQWIHEIKLDGYRMVCRIDGGKTEVLSRNHKSWTDDLPHLVKAAALLPVKQAVLDGELVAFKPDGTTDFQTMQNAFKEHRVGELVYYVFDLLYLNGIDLRNVALTERKQLLEKLVPPGEHAMIRYCEHVVGNGPEFFAQASKLGLEGIICKLAAGIYTAGRSDDWLKVKASNREEFVIGGFTDPGARGGFGALLLGYHDKKHELVYAGKVGTGYSDEFLASFRKRLDMLTQEESPFADLRRLVGEARGAHWVRPQLVAQVGFTQWTREGRLRHPVFLGLREDKPASAVVRDRAVEAPAAVTEVVQAATKAASRSRKSKMRP